MKIVFSILLTVVVGFVSIHAYAENCKLQVTREVCPGKDAKTILSKYGGSKTANESALKNSENACLAFAKEACIIVHKGNYSEKKVTGTFEDKPLEGGENICKSVPESKGICSK